MVLASVFIPFAKAQGTVIATVKVGAGPWGVAYDPGKNQIFVTDHGSNSVSVISDSTNAVVATVPVESEPIGVAYDSAKGEIFVADSNSDSVSVISDSSDKVVATVGVGIRGTLGNDPESLAYDPARGEIFVANAGSDTVSVISDSTNAVVATIDTGHDPEGIAYDPGEGEVFVANHNDSTTSVISDSNDTVITTVRVEVGPEGVAYDSAKGEMFVTDTGSNAASVISDSNDTVAATVSVGSDPEGIAYDPGEGEVFVADHGGDAVSIISSGIATVVATTPVGSEPVGVAYDSGKGEVFVTNYGSDTLSVISDASTSLDFDLTISPSSQGIGPGRGFNATVSVGRVNDTSGVVMLSVSGPAGTTLPAEVPLNGTPPFMTILSGVAPLVPGNYLFVVTGRAGDVTHAASLTITVLSPSIVLSSTSGAPGSSVTVTGEDFPPVSNISVTIGHMQLGTVVSTPRGTFVASFSVPQASGNYMIAATGSNNVGAAQPFTVEPSPFPWIVLAGVAIALACSVGGFWAVRQSRLQLRPNNPKFTVAVTVTSSVRERKEEAR